MLKVLFITSSASPHGRENVGDRVILAGARNLVAAAFGYYLYREHGRWGRFEGDPNDYDLIVYAGMPQFGARDTPAREEVHFQDIIDRSTRPVFMNIGGGTIHPFGLNYEYEAEKMARSGGADYYRKQESRIAYRSVRDRTSKIYFDRIGVKAELRCCPSFYSTLTIAPGAKRPGAIAALNNTTFVSNRVRGDLGDVMTTLADRHPGMDIVSHSGTDLGLLADLGREHLFFRSEVALLSYYATVERLYALRIHAAVPAWTMGARVVLGGFDNRTGLFDDVAMPVQWVNMITESQGSIIEQFERLMDDDRSHAPLEERRRLVQERLALARGEVRAAAPDLIEKSSDTPLSEEGWISHPPAGSVSIGEDGFTLSRVPLDLPIGDEASGTDIVRIPAGSRASAAAATPTFPRVLPGKRFTGGRADVSGNRIEAALKGLNGNVGSTEIKVPRGRYTVKAGLTLSAGDAPGADGALVLSATQDGVPLGERTVSGDDLRGDKSPTLEFGFENRYPAMPILLRLEAREFSGSEQLSLAQVEVAAVAS